MPIARSSAIVGDGQNPDSVRAFQVDDVVGKSPDGQASHRKVLRHAGYVSACSRQGQDTPQRGIHFVKELHAQPCDAGLVPPATFPVFDAGLVLESDDHSLGFPQGSLSVGAHFFPRNPRGFPRHDPSGAPFDLFGPSLLNGGRILRPVFVKAREQFGRKVSPFVNREVQGVTENRLRSRGHGAILDPGAQPNKRLHQTAG